MANFAVAASEETIKQGKELIAKLANPGENQGETLARIFSITAANIDGEKLRENDVNVTALDTTLQNIRRMFTAALAGKTEIINAKESEIDEVKAAKDQMEMDLRRQLTAAEVSKEEAEKNALGAEKAMQQAQKDLVNSEKMREAAEKTASDKQTIADTLAARLAEADKKAKDYDDLYGKYSTLETANKSLEQQIKDQERDYKESLKDAQHKAEAAQIKAVSEARDELQNQISALEKQLFEAQKETALAKQNAESAHQAAIAELSAAHSKEIGDLRQKLDDRTEELLSLQKKNSDLEIQIAKLQGSKN